MGHVQWWGGNGGARIVKIARASRFELLVGMFSGAADRGGAGVEGKQWRASRCGGGEGVGGHL